MYIYICIERESVLLVKIILCSEFYYQHFGKLKGFHMRTHSTRSSGVVGCHVCRDSGGSNGRSAISTFSVSTQRASKGFSAQIGPPSPYLIRRNPPYVPKDGVP